MQRGVSRSYGERGLQGRAWDRIVQRMVIWQQQHTPLHAFETTEKCLVSEVPPQRGTCTKSNASSGLDTSSSLISQGILKLAGGAPLVCR